MRFLIFIMPMLIFFSCGKEDTVEQIADKEQRIFKDHGICVELLQAFVIKVPADYVHEKQVENLRKFLGDTTKNSIITDKNLEKTTDRLIPGQTYSVRIYNVIAGGTNCYNTNYCGSLYTDYQVAMDSMNLLSVGFQGLALAYQLSPQSFTEKFYMSIDLQHESFVFHHDSPSDPCFLSLIYFLIPALADETGRFEIKSVSSLNPNLSTVHLVLFSEK